MTGSTDWVISGRRLIQRMFVTGVCAIGLAFAVVLLVLYPFFPGLLIEFRFAIFSRVVPDAAAFDLPPPRLYASGFLTDDPAVISIWREITESELPQMSNLPADFDRRPTLERAKRLAQLNSGGGGSGVLFSDHETLIDRLHRVPDGVGYCSDLAETFLALCNVNRIDAYEFSLTLHTIASVYCPEMGCWVAIDPQFCLLFRGADGAYLSPAQLRDQSLAGRPVQIESFWDETNGPASHAPESLGYYSGPEAFRDFIMTYGNNVFAVDDVRRKWRWVPKPIRQIYYRAIGVMPDYLIVNDAHAGRAKSLPARRFALVGVAGVLLAMILPQILVWIICRFRPRAGVCGRHSIAADEMREVRSARP